MEQIKSIWRHDRFRHARRTIIFVFGLTIVLIGIAMIILPGPAIVFIPLGLAVLGTEFIWAKRLLNSLKRSAKKLHQKLPKKIQERARRRPRRKNRFLNS